MARAFSPDDFGCTTTWGVAPGWDGDAPLALTSPRHRNPPATLGRATSSRGGAGRGGGADGFGASAAPPLRGQNPTRPRPRVGQHPGGHAMTAFGARTLGRFTVRTHAGIGIIHARPAWRMLKRAEARAPIPTGLHHSAQGCRVREATLGNMPKYVPQPQRGCITPRRADGCNPFRVVSISERFPRVARASQPWAGRHYPVGVIIPADTRP
jgi:hypothetical protein